MSENEHFNLKINYQLIDLQVFKCFCFYGISLEQRVMDKINKTTEL